MGDAFDDFERRGYVTPYKTRRRDNMSDKVFAEGINFFEPFDNAPDFILGNISVNAEKLVPWLRSVYKEHANERGYLKLVVKRSQKGKVYIEIDTYKPEDKDKIQPESEEAPW